MTKFVLATSLVAALVSALAIRHHDAKITHDLRMQIDGLENELGIADACLRYASSLEQAQQCRPGDRY